MVPAPPWIDRRGAMRQQGGLRDVAVHGDVGRLRTERRRIVVLSHRHDHRHRLVPQALQHGREDAEVAVVDRPQGEIDQRPVRKSGDFVGHRPWRDGDDRTHGLDRRYRCQLPVLQSRRADVDVEVAQETGERIGLQPPCSPVLRCSPTGCLQQLGRDQRAVADVDIGQSARGAHEGRRHLRHLVDDEVRAPPVQHLVQVLGPWREFEVGEDLAEEEAPLLVADQPVPPGEPRRPLGSEVRARSGRQGLEAVLARSGGHRRTAGERDRVAGVPSGGGQRNDAVRSARPVAGR